MLGIIPEPLSGRNGTAADKRGGLRFFGAGKEVGQFDAALRIFGKYYVLFL